MTRLELKELRKTFPCYSDKTKLYKTWTKQEKQNEKIYNCINMLHSILTYTSNYDFENIINNKYLKDYINELGYTKVAELTKNEIKEFENVQIITNCFTDDEGNCYNSTIFKDEI